jgi:hypothetical protein
MSDPISRRAFTTTFAASVVLGADAIAADPVEVAPMPSPKAVEAPLDRDYPPPTFKPQWRKPQINRVMVQDFVMYSHGELAMVKRLLEKEPGLLHSSMDWGGGDFESGLGAASHVGNRAIAEFLLSKGARIDIFCAAMMGQLEVVKGLLTAFPNLIDAKGPHGIGLHLHAKFGGKEAEKVLDYLQTLKKVEFPPPKAKKPE